MPRLPLVALSVLIAAMSVPVASSQPVAPDSVARRPDFSVPLPGDFAPPQTSAARAYTYALLATGATVGAGVLLIEALGEPPVEGTNLLYDAGPVIIIAGAAIGPSVANLSLGAAQDVGRALTIKMVGLGTGIALGGTGLLIGAGCVVSELNGGGDAERCGPAVTALLTGGIAAAAAGMVIGTGYDLATVPGNAARARQYRAAYPRVALAPGWRAGSPTAVLRVGL